MKAKEQNVPASCQSGGGIICRTGIMKGTEYAINKSNRNILSWRALILSSQIVIMVDAFNRNFSRAIYT